MAILNCDRLGAGVAGRPAILTSPAASWVQERTAEGDHLT
jgi:hypothetical protein